jgi:hypothetical protein
MPVQVWSSRPGQVTPGDRHELDSLAINVVLEVEGSINNRLLDMPQFI